MTEELPSGNILISEEGKPIRFLMIKSGFSFSIEILANEYEYMTDDWIKRENEIHDTIKEFS